MPHGKHGKMKYAKILFTFFAGQLFLCVVACVVLIDSRAAVRCLNASHVVVIFLQTMGAVCCNGQAVYMCTT